MKFYIRYGLNGGFGGRKNKEWEEVGADSLEDAWHYAYESAIEEYEGYVGSYGLRTVDEIMSEDDVDEDEAMEIYLEERESWLDYEAVEEKPND